MNRRVVLFIVAAGMFAVAPLAKGQAYTASILFPLTTPSGFVANGSGAEGNGVSAGQVVGFGDELYNGGNQYGNQALLWTAASVADLNPTGLGYTGSEAYGTNGTEQVGEGSAPGNTEGAPLWTGTAASAVNLNPTNLPGISGSTAFGTNGTQQVGFGFGSGTGLSQNGSPNPNALLWNGTAASAVDLNPASLGITSSEANGTSGLQQVGYGSGSGTGGNIHALLWTGTSASAVDLNPANLGITSSTAGSISGIQQVGEGFSSGTGGNGHALVWSGTAASAVDLNPTGFTSSGATATNGTEQVGTGDDDALVWFGTAASVINLGALLPTTTLALRNSGASSIDSSGNIYGIATVETNDGPVEYAVEWSPVPGSMPGPVSWAAAVDGSWSSAPNWSAQNVPDSIVGVNFNTGSATPYAVTLAASSSANSITVQDNVTIQKAGFNLAVPGEVTISGTAGQHASLTLAGAGLSTFGSLSITNGQLDVTDNTVIINYGVGNPTPVGSIGAYVASGYNGGAWNGVGIVSSEVASVNAAHSNPHLYGVGYADASDVAVAVDHFSPGTVVIEPAIVGDANLDGVVNFSDFQLLAASFNQANTSWDQGNFNYGAKTDFTDFQLLAANFNDSTSLDAAEFDAMDQFAKGFGDSLLANSNGVGFAIVPEPGAMGMLGVAGLGILSRRKTRSASRRG